MRRLAALLLALASASLPAAAATLTISGSGAQEPAAANVAAGTPGVYAGRVILIADAGTITVNALQVATAGTGVAGSDLAALQLYDDANQSGTFDGADALLGTARWSSSASRWIFSGLAVSVPTSGHSVFLVLSAASGAVTGRTFIMKVTGADVTAGASDTVATSSATGNAFTFLAGAADGSPNAAAPTVLLLNPSDGSALSGTFRVQVQVYNPGGLPALTSVKLSKDNGADAYALYAFDLSADLNARYSVGADAAVYETQLSLTPGAYTLKVQASNAAAGATSHGAVVTVNGAGVGDGNLLVRDNSSELCLDCHAMKTHSSQETGPQYGSWSVVCRDCHTPHNTTNIYLARRSITPPSVNGYQTAKDVAFSTTTGDSGQPGLTNRPAASYANSDNSGICQVCHTRTKNPATSAPRWRNTGNADTHHAGPSTERCTTCHSHQGGFKMGESGGSSDCSSCHPGLFAPMNGTAAYHHLMNNSGVTALASGSKYPKASALGAAADANRRCLACHADHDLFRPDLNTTGGGRGKNLRTSANVLPGTSPGGTGFTQTDYGYASGTAAFDGTATVTGTSSFWSGNVAAGAQTFIWNRCNDTWYGVSAVGSDTQLTLSAAGAACAGGPYRIVNLASPDGSGICLSCHVTAQAKSYAQDDGTAQTPAISAAAFRDSVHEFQVSSTFGGSPPQNTFFADCSKCHTDTLPKTKQTSAYPDQFGLHDSPLRRMNHPMGNQVATGTASGAQGTTTLVDTSQAWSAGQFDGYAVTIKDGNGIRTGVVASVAAPDTLNLVDPWAVAPVDGTTTYTIADPLEERFCTQCHSGGAAGTDYYGVKPMSEPAKRFDQFLKLYATGTMAVAAGTKTVTGTGTAWWTSGTADATFTQNSNVVTGTDTTWDASMVGWSIQNTAITPHQWYTIVKVDGPTSLVISPSYRGATAAGASWELSIANWYLKCSADPDALWYRITDVTSATSLAVYPAYPADCSGAFVARSSSGHPMSVSAGIHEPGESSLPSPWNSGANRHVTCTDCHEPHAAQPGRHAPGGTGTIGGANVGTWGVVLTWPQRTVTATFANASRAVTSSSEFLATDVGKNIVGPDGIVYRITAFTDASTITIGEATGTGYKGADATAAVPIQDGAAPPSFSAVSSLSTSDLQAELCFKCHSSYAYGASPPSTSFFDSRGQGAAAAQSDVANDFNPGQLAYHPVLDQGRNQPAADANPNWAISDGRKANPPNTGLDNNFVDGWSATSRVTCTDCHASDSPEDPWGPHGSANQWLLKGIDPDVTVTIADGGATYPNRCYYRGSAPAPDAGVLPDGGIADGGPGVVPDTGDSKNLCLNCHRADVYGLVTGAGNAGGTSCDSVDQTTQVHPILYANLSRVTHPVDNRTHSNAVTRNALTRWGIYCMQCHGGESLGAIHGTDAARGAYGKSYRGKRFLAGATWIGVTRATTTAGVSCWTKTSADSVNTCTHDHGVADGGYGRVANYDYDPGGD